MGCLNFSACQSILFLLLVTVLLLPPPHTIAAFLRGDQLRAAAAQAPARHHPRTGGPVGPDPVPLPGDPKGGLDGIAPSEDTPTLPLITDNGLRDAKDREKAFLSELIKRLNEALGREISDTDQVAFAVHVSERLTTQSRAIGRTI